MSFKSAVLLAFVGFVGISNISASSPTTLFIQQRAEQALMNQMAKYSSSPIARAGVSDCQPYYSKLLQQLVDKFEKTLVECNVTEKNQLEGLMNEGNESRKSTTKKMQDICESIDKCIAKDKDLEYMDCVKNSGDKNSRGIWTASKDSSDAAAHIREQIHVIQFSTAKCKSDAEREYIVSTTKCTDDMLECFANGGAIPTTQPPESPSTTPSEESSSEPTTIESSTPTDASSSAETSTDSASTVSSEPTAASTEPSTDAPSTEGTTEPTAASTEPSTDAPSTEGTTEPTAASTEPSTDAPSTEGSTVTTEITTEQSTPAPTTTEEAERDQVEELEEDENITNRKRLEEFMKSWGKRV